MSTSVLSLSCYSRVVDHAKWLISRASVTPDDGGCQQYIALHLAALGFSCEQHTVNGVSNLIARWGQGPVHLAFSGHTDVVPPGPLAHWRSPPFAPTLIDNRLTGRGAADMKTGIAAMLAATQRTIEHADPDVFSFWWLITSDEEGEAEYGSKWINAYLNKQGIELDMCLVGEPTASHQTGDTIKVGRRGSLSATVTVTGKQGHVAYPHRSINAIHNATQLVQQLLTHQWDKGSADFPGTTLQVTHMDTGKFTDNLVPGTTRFEFNVRYSHQFNESSLKARLSEIIAQTEVQAEISFSRPCESYLSQPRASCCLIRATEASIVQTTGRYPVISTSGGTSDGRFFASDRTQVVEVGVPNTTIHQVNESVHLSDLMTLEDIYVQTLSAIFREDRG